jgi:rhodanese-related sulfurtransferase
MVKSSADLIAAASAEVETLSVDEVKRRADQGGAVLLDVREPSEVAKGKIAGAVHVPRGLLEFAADPANPMHNQALSSGQPVIVYCGSGGRSALAAKTLKDMGLDRVSHMEGGFGAWKAANYEVETEG